MVKLDADPEVAFGKFWIYHGVANLRGVRSAVEGGATVTLADTRGSVKAFARATELKSVARPPHSSRWVRF